MAFLPLESPLPTAPISSGWLACVVSHPSPPPPPPCSHRAHGVNRQLAGPGLGAVRERAQPPGDKEPPGAAEARLIPELICSLGFIFTVLWAPCLCQGPGTPTFAVFHGSFIPPPPLPIPSALLCCSPAPSLSLRLRDHCSLALHPPRVQWKGVHPHTPEFKVLQAPFYSGVAEASRFEVSSFSVLRRGRGRGRKMVPTQKAWAV